MNRVQFLIIVIVTVLCCSFASIKIVLYTLPTLQFHDQFAFRPTGSPTAAIISLMNTVINLLTTEPYVIVLSFDFSKAFDTVRHFTLLQKLAQLDLPDHVYSWLTDFLHECSLKILVSSVCASGVLPCSARTRTVLKD